MEKKYAPQPPEGGVSDASANSPFRGPGGFSPPEGGWGAYLSLLKSRAEAQKSPATRSRYLRALSSFASFILQQQQQAPQPPEGGASVASANSPFRGPGGFYLPDYLISLRIAGTPLSTASLYLNILSSLWTSAVKAGQLPPTDAFAHAKAALRALPDGDWDRGITEEIFQRALRLTRNARHLVASDAEAARHLIALLTNGLQELEEAPEEAPLPPKGGASDAAATSPFRGLGGLNALFRRARLPQSTDPLTTIESIWAYAAIRVGIPASQVVAYLGHVPLGLPLLSLSQAQAPEEAPQPPKGGVLNSADPVYYPELKKRAAEKRNKPTDAERRMWNLLKSPELEGYKFRRQHIIGQYIVDFVCLDKMLVIEVDGKYHDNPSQKEDDKIREDVLKSKGYSIIRFTNDEVEKDPFDVISKLKERLCSSPFRGLGGLVGDLFLPPSPQWFAMGLRPGVRYEDLLARLAQTPFRGQGGFSPPSGGWGASLYYPSQAITRAVGNKIITRQRPFIRSVVFFRASAADIPELFFHIGDIAWCYRENSRPGAPYAGISDARFALFQRTIASLTRDFEIAPAGDLPLRPGDRVEILGGLFSGLHTDIDAVISSPRADTVYRLNIIADNGIEWRLTLPAARLQKVAPKP